MSSEGGEARASRWPLVLLALLALLDLRIELQLLLDHFTWTSFFAMPVAHPLAIAVLLLMPGLWRSCR